MKLLKMLQRIGELLRPPRKRTGYLMEQPGDEIEPVPHRDSGPSVHIDDHRPGDARYSPVGYRL